MKKLIITILTLASLSGSVFADQCAYITKDQVQKGVKALALENTITKFCERCGDSKGTEIKVESLGYRFTGTGNYYEVTVNDEGVDLAYIYAKNINVAKMVNCPTKGVGRKLKINQRAEI